MDLLSESMKQWEARLLKMIDDELSAELDEEDVLRIGVDEILGDILGDGDIWHEAVSAVPFYTKRAIDRYLEKDYCP